MFHSNKINSIKYVRYACGQDNYLFKFLGGLASLYSESIYSETCL